MSYTSNKLINGLDVETTIADTDELIFGDVSDTNRAKKITFANLKTEIVGDDTAFVRKTDYDANTILYATADNTPLALTVGTNSVVGRVAGNITTLAVDSDLTSVSANDDTVPSAKATKTALDTKEPTITTLTVAKGGTGLGTLTANNLIVGAGTSNVTFIAPGTSGNILTSNGTTWASTAPTSTSAYACGQTTRASGSGTGTQNIAHGLGVKPKMVKILATEKTSSNQTMTISNGSATSTSNETCTYFTPNSVGTVTTGQDSTHILLTRTSGGTSWSATLSTLDSTNITLNFDSSGDSTVYTQ